jgi:uncharacterized phage protein (TIGR01671 family)
MREIKLRAWDKHKKKFLPDDVYAILSKHYAGAILIMLKDFEDYREGEFGYEHSIVLLQYTGLKDKNGKEIYEGNVIKIEVKKRNKGDFPNLKNYLVVFEDFSFSYKDNEGYYATPLNIFIKGVEVIGNIYENPELLDNK